MPTSLWDFPLAPPQASTFSVPYDNLYNFITLVTIVVSLIVFLGTFYIIFKYRAGSNADRTEKEHTGATFEILLSMPPLIFGIIVFLWSGKLFGDVYNPPKDTYDVSVIGKQWMWHLQHPNGIRENNMLHVPTGLKVRLTVISQDVIHSFFVPAFRIKRDVIPGRYNNVWFEATEPGEYHIFCAEYCGTKHSEMIGTVYVMKPDDYARWQADMFATTRSNGTAIYGGATDQVSLGKNLYENQYNCAQCHVGANSRGPSHIGLYGSKVKLADGRTVIADESYLRESILDPNAKIVAGYQPNIMPVYKGQVSEEQVLQLVAFLKSESTKGAAGAAKSNAAVKKTAPQKQQRGVKKQ